MSYNIIRTSTLKDIADAIREKSGKTDGMSASDMAEEISQISTGAELPELSNEGSSSDLLAGKELIDSKGNVVTGAIPTKDATTIIPSTTRQIAVAGGMYTSGDITVEGDSNLVASNIKSGISIFGVDGTLETGSGGGAPSNETAILDRTISGTYTNDVITSIGSYAFCSCKNLISVSFPAVTAIRSSAFYYCTNLTTASFPVAKTIGDSAFYCCSSLTEANFPAVTNMGGNTFSSCRNLITANFPVASVVASSMFFDCSSLTTVSFPEATSIGFSAFYGCNKLTTANFPLVKTLNSNVFRECSSLTTISFPAATSIGGSAFRSCANLTTVSFPVAKSIASCAFQDCTKLTTVYLIGSLCTLSNSNAFSNAGITSAAGSIYVPASLLTSYKTAAQWSYFSTRFVGI